MSDVIQSNDAGLLSGGEALTGPHFRLTTAQARLPAATRTTGPVLLAAHDLRKSYRKGPVSIPVLNGVDLEVRQAEFLSVVGKGGSGKTTLLHGLATLHAPE